MKTTQQQMMRRRQRCPRTTSIPPCHNPSDIGEESTGATTQPQRRPYRKSRRRPNAAAAAAAAPSPLPPPRRSKWTVAIVATLSLSTIASIAHAEGEVDYQDCWDALWDADVQHGNSDGKVKEDEYPKFVQDLDDLYNPGDDYFDDMDSFNELPILLTTKFREIACDSIIGSCFGSNAGLDAILADPRGRPDDDETTYLNELCRDVLATMELVKTPAPSRTPTKAPTVSPKPTPVGGPVPTEFPTSVPTEIPTKSPTGSPSVPPTGVPTASPSSGPSGFPTSVPTSNPTAVPSYSPSESPIDGTAAPSLPTTSRPSDAPSLRPSSGPTDASDRSTPSSSPTSVPTPGPSIPPTSPPVVDSDVSYTGPLTVNVSFVISSQGLTAESVKLGNIIVSKLEGALTKLATRVFLTEVSLRSLLEGAGVRGRRKLSSVTYDPTNNPAIITSVTDVNCPSSVLDGTLTCQICEATIVLDAIDVPLTSKANEVTSKLQDEIDFGFLGSQLESDDPNSLVSVLKVREGPAPTASPAPSAEPSAAPKPPTNPEPALKAQEESDDSSGGLPTGAIVGIAVGCVALAGAALYGLLYTKRKNRAVSKSRKGRKKRENVELSSDNGSWRDEPGDNSKTHLVGAVPATYGDSDRNMLTTIDGVPSPEQSQSKESAAAAQATPNRGAAPPAVAPAPENDARGSSQAGSRSVSSGYSAGSDPHLTIDKILAQPSPSSDDQESYASSSGAGSSGWSSSLGGSSSTITGQSSITGSGIEAAAAAAAVAAAQQQQQREQERERTELDSLVSDMDKSAALPVITDDDTDTDDDTEEDDSTYESDSFLEGTSTATDDDVEEEEDEDDSTYHTEDYTEGSYTQATPSLDAAAVLSSEPRSDPRNALDAAIEAGDWAAVGATAALLASATEDRTEGQSTASGSRSQSFGYVGSGRAATQETDDGGGTAGGGALDADRAAELEYLVEAGDWEGVVSAAARFEALSEVERAEHDESTDLTGADGYMGSESSRHDDDATSTSDDRSHTSDDYGDSTDFTTDDDDEEETGDSMGSSYYSAGASTQTSVSLSAEDLSPEERRHRAEVRAEVEALVRIVVPEEVDNVDVMMMQFKGREDELLSTLRTMQSRSVTQRARASVHKSHKRAAAVSVDGGSGHTPGGASVASRSVGSASSAGSRSRHSQSQGGAGSVLSNPAGATAPYSRTQGMYDARHPSEDTFNSFGDTTYGDTIHSGGNASSENESYGFSDPELRSTRRDQNNLNAVSRGAELPPMLASMARASLNQQNSGSNPNSRPGSAGGGSGPNSRPGSAGSRPGSGENSIGKEGGVVFMDTDEESDDFREQH